MATATINHHIRLRPLFATPLPPPVSISERVFYSAPLNPNKLVSVVRECNILIAAYLPPSRPPSSASRTHFNPSTKLFVSGLSFRTTEESLRTLVSLLKRTGRGALHYAMAEESKKAIEGMHGKFLEGRVIFFEVAKSRSELRERLKHKPGESCCDPSQ